MTAESALLILFGMLSGGWLGYLTAWRTARKLEHHGVLLWKWDRHFDAQATPDNVVPLTRQSQR